MSAVIAPAFCGQPHRLEDGKPVEHSCFVLRPDLLREEAGGRTRGLDPRVVPHVPHKGLDASGEETAPSTHAELCKRAGLWLRNNRGCSVVLVDHKGLRTQEQPDAIGWKSATHSYLVECKASRADFLADKKKPFRRSGLGMGHFRYYFCPPDVIQVADLPPLWGLLYWEKGRVAPVHKAQAHAMSSAPGLSEERALLIHCIERIVGGYPLDSLLRKEE